MSSLRYESAIATQSHNFNNNIKRKPFLKIIESTKDMPVPLCYDSRSEEEVMNCIKIRMRIKLNKNHGYNINRR